jgi:hypothetical protein
MHDAAYIKRRDEIQTYFDRTALDAWKRLTSTEKVSGIRATVRAGARPCAMPSSTGFRRSERLAHSRCRLRRRAAGHRAGSSRR